MAFKEGTASSFADLLSQVKAELLTAGYTNPSGNLMQHSGSYWRLEANTNYFRLMPFANAAQTDYPNDGSYMVGGGSAPLLGVQFPCAFKLYIDTAPVPEVFISVNYNELYYQWIAFGKSAVTLPGTGTWCSGSFNSTVLSNCEMSAYTNAVDGARSNSYTTHLPFCATSGNLPFGEHIHHGLAEGDSTWSRADILGASIAPAPMLRYTPLDYSTQVLLIPVVAMLRRSEYDSAWHYVPVLECQNIRLFMFDTGTAITPGKQITLGSDLWDLWPAYQLDRANQYKTYGGAKSGCFGIAVRRTA